MKNEAYESKNLDFTRNDAYDHMSRLEKHIKVENEYANVLVQHLIDKTNKDNTFTGIYLQLDNAIE